MREDSLRVPAAFFSPSAPLRNAFARSPGEGGGDPFFPPRSCSGADSSERVTAPSARAVSEVPFSMIWALFGSDEVGGGFPSQLCVIGAAEVASPQGGELGLLIFGRGDSGGGVLFTDPDFAGFSAW